MMETGAMEALIKAAKDAGAAAPSNVPPLEIDGHQYTAQKLNRIEKVREPELTAIEVSTLAAFIDFVQRDGLDDDYKDTTERFVMVAGPQTVVLKSHVFGDLKQREDLIIAKAGLTPFPFGTYLAHEEFIIALATKFVQTPALTQLLELIAAVSDENISTSKDDGLTQEAIVKTGLAIEKRVGVPTRPKLQPFRSFPDIEPVESTFLLRAKRGQSGPTFALMETDGGDWKPKTTALLVTLLRERMPDYLVIG